MSAALLGWAVEALIASTLLMGLVLLVRRHAQRALGPQLAYWLWALPVLRMVTPPLPAEWRESAAAPISAAGEIVMVYLADAPAVGSAAPVEAGIPWLAVMSGLWLVGGIAFFVWHGLAHRDYVRRILSPPASRARLEDGTTLVESDAAVGPVAFGVFRRFVAVPRDFAERYDEDERRLALAHELGHHARGDLIANWIGLAMLAIHWFNPLAWVAYRKFRADQEMANDARVLAALPPIERHAYACAIVKAAHGRAVTAACHLHTIDDLKGRLRMLKASRKSRRVMMAGATGIAALTMAGLGLTASGAAAQKIAATAAVQVPLLASKVAPVPVPPSDVAPPAPPAPPADGEKRKHVVVVNKDGETKRYEGADADAYIASNPDLKKFTDGSFEKDLEKKLENRMIFVRTKDGKSLGELSPEMKTKLKSLEGMRVTMAPMPPLPPGVATPPIIQMWNTSKGGKMTAHLKRGSGGNAFAFASPSVSEGKCTEGSDKDLIVSGKDKDGKPRMIICTSRIQTFADSQARFGKLRALEGLRTGRASIEGNRNLTDEQRTQALAGIDEARASIEAELKGEAAPK